MKKYVYSLSTEVTITGDVDTKNDPFARVRVFNGLVARLKEEPIEFTVDGVTMRAEFTGVFTASA